jgi:hypothetical protein
MSTNTLCYYSVARFIPDLLRNEPKNIGVLLYSDVTNEYASKFLTNLKNKIGNSALSSDKDIIHHYDKYFKELNPHSKEDLVKKTESSEGKIQFSEVKAVVTKDFNKELEYLYSTFVDDVPQTEVKRHRFKTSIKKEFKSLDIIGKNKFVADQEVDGGKSKIKHQVDFSFQNGKLYVIEAVDLSKNDKRDTFETAFKFEDLKFGLKNRVETISIVQYPEDVSDDVSEFVEILKATSTYSINFSNGQREAFLKRMKKLVAS